MKEECTHQIVLCVDDGVGRAVFGSPQALARKGARELVAA